MPVCRAAPGMGPVVPLANSKPTNRTQVEVVSEQVGRRQLSLQGAGCMVVQVRPHGSVRGPAPRIGGISTRAAGHRAEHSSGRWRVAHRGPLPIWARMACLAYALPTVRPATPTTGRLCLPGAALTLEKPRSAPSHPCSTIRRSRLHERGVAAQVEGMRQQAALAAPQGCRRIETADVRLTADLPRAGQRHVHRKPSPQKAAEQAAENTGTRRHGMLQQETPLPQLLEN